ncbi:MAG: hypothetical protein R3F61_04495 [Myxococcota bacterium]
MALEIQYDADGCEGVLERHEGAALQLEDLARAGIALLVTQVVASLALGTPWRGLSVTVALALGMAGVWSVWRSMNEQHQLSDVVRERFQVRRGHLTVHTADGVWSAPLAGARIVAFKDGVWVNPALGAAIRLVWDGATKKDVDELVAVLSAAASRELARHGTRDDVPEAIRSLQRE